ncbi:peroxisome biogenesis protein 2 [Dorcoceras hygrometricum]|uniref:Peroxisome biogenesis protein 2 n=1 Tax=Dorcoceras hygrometricum TaxID=472368 RepID=A0A2Z7DF84_9LAMI|nr:peroxisome biogenesis protein 2 [Dorcoceras hygrometricum]
MVVDLIGIYGLKGPYCTLTTNDWFLQALSVIPRGSWGDVARRFTMIRWATLLVQPDEGVSDLVVDRIGDNLPQSTEKSRILVIPVGARYKCQQDQDGRNIIARRLIGAAARCGATTSTNARAGRTLAARSPCERPRARREDCVAVRRSSAAAGRSNGAASRRCRASSPARRRNFGGRPLRRRTLPRTICRASLHASLSHDRRVVAR